MWSEEEMREIPDLPPARRARGQAATLRAEVSGRNLARMQPADELTRGQAPNVIFGPGPPGSTSHGNFIDASYRRILANADWARRLTKAHAAKRQAGATGAAEEVRTWRELDAATSSDALLMNVFCYPRVLEAGSLRALLGIEPKLTAEFGVRSNALLIDNHVNTTEIDLRLGDLLIEAKLTEGDFQFAPMRLLDRYQHLDEVFDRQRFQVTRRGVAGYQLVRGVLAAHAVEGRFCVLCDGRRTDLIADWGAIMAAVWRPPMQARLRLVTWQEIANCVPLPLRRFLADKYGIRSTNRHRGSSLLAALPKNVVR